MTEAELLNNRITALRAKNLAPVAKVRRGVRLDNSAAVASLYLYDDIGGYDGIMAKDVLDALKGAKGGPVDLHVNSGGGDIFEAHAIHNVIRRYSGAVTAYVDGIAASAASYILMACDAVWMEPNAQIMIHDGFGGGPGHPADLRETADVLDLLSDSIAGMYAQRAGGTPEEWRARMTATTWYNAAQAVAAGLANGIRGDADPVKPVNGVRWVGEHGPELIDRATLDALVGGLAKLHEAGQLPWQADAIDPPPDAGLFSPEYVATVVADVKNDLPPEWFGGLTGQLKGLFS